MACRDKTPVFKFLNQNRPKKESKFDIKHYAKQNNNNNNNN
jgi:hypothetical protein